MAAQAHKTKSRWMTRSKQARNPTENTPKKTQPKISHNPAPIMKMMTMTPAITPPPKTSQRNPTRSSLKNLTANPTRSLTRTATPTIRTAATPAFHQQPQPTSKRKQTAQSKSTRQRAAPPAAIRAQVAEARTMAKTRRRRARSRAPTERPPSRDRSPEGALMLQAHLTKFLFRSD